MTERADLTIRPATVNDIDDLLDLEEMGFRLDLFDRRQYRYLISKARSAVLVAEISGQLRGAAVMLWRENSSSGRLYNIVVDPRSHGTGVGAQLLNACEREAVVKGCRAVTLEVRIDNERAIAFYLKHGYKRIKKMPHYYSDNAPALKMRKALG